ncbi:MAG TPA: cysteate synthase [Candidatus Limnocylindria bacterium]|jgi:cysteate synthase|nr:cysteate synthase [Candidatus Limnocylindria bacterium]
MDRREYRLRCSACGTEFDDDGVRLTCSHSHAPALLRTVYARRRLEVEDVASMARYRYWLPAGRELCTDARTAVFRSDGLARYLRLKELWIAFSGWWPERGATLATTSFKELEAVAVLGRLAPDERRTLVVASAGNTAAAFARAGTELGIPTLIVIPLDAWERLASLVDVGPPVRVVAIEGAGYDEAIALAARIASIDGYVAEGGVRNVARRDGMGTILLAAAEAIGTLPDAYFQAVGSAAGALATHEAALRLLADGRYGTRVPRLMLSQNAPFTPIHDAWVRRSPSLEPRDPALAREQVRALGASVLSNQAPPYATIGGIREALVASNGTTYAISNDEMTNAMALFAELEGIDIEPAAGIATASLIRAARASEVAPDARVLLNITGGGAKRRAREGVNARPTLIVDRTEPATAAVDRVRSLFA